MGPEYTYLLISLSDKYTDMEHSSSIITQRVWGDSTAATVVVVKDALASTVVQKLYVHGFPRLKHHVLQI